jgi:ribonuclease VapC
LRQNVKIQDATPKIVRPPRSFSFQIEHCTAQHLELAREAYARYGKGRNSAGLNHGDCFSYALVKTTGLPLLFKGSDFSKTDLVAALPHA